MEHKTGTFFGKFAITEEGSSKNSGNCQQSLG